MIEVANVSKEYITSSGKIRALDGISLTVQRGQRIGVIGRNGSGKSTLIRLIGGVEFPTSGTISRRMAVSWPLAFRGGFQKELSGYENIRFISRVYEVPFREIAEKVEDFSELGARLRDPVQTYSSGMLGKLSFGLSLAIDFDCYLIDEVLAVGDARFRAKCRQEMFEKRGDKALLIVSHQAATIKQACSIGILIDNGKHVDTFDIGSGSEWQKYASG